MENLTPRNVNRALKALEGELARMSPTTLLPVNRDITAVSIIVLGAAPEARRYRAQMVEQFGEERASLVDRLELLAYCAEAAQAEHACCSTGEDLVPIGQAVAEARASLVREIEALISRKRLPKGTLSRLKRAHGYRNHIADVILLVSILQLSWPEIEGATGLKVADLHRAEALANKLAIAVGVREQGAAAPSRELRQRAYTLLVRTYDGVRRMLTYLRWEEGDADRIAPSLYGGRRRRRPLGDVQAPPVEAAFGAAAGGDASMLGGNPFPSG